MNSFVYEKVDQIPDRKGSKYRTLVDELKKMPGQWVRLEKRYDSGTKAGKVVGHLKTYYECEATARTADNTIYHVYVRYPQREEQGPTP